MADLLQALAADVIAGAGISPSEPISNHPDLLRRYTELSKVIQVWNTEGDKTAVRREVNLIKAQLSYSKDVISAQKTFATNNMKERNNALNALSKLETALIASSTKLTAARNTQSEYIMQKVAAVAGRPGSGGSGPRAWSAVNGILGEEGLIGRVPDPALPLLLARMKDTYGHSGLGPHAEHELKILTQRAHKASVVQKAALARNKQALKTVESLTSRAAKASDKSPELAKVIQEARGFSGKMAAFMEEEVGLTNKAELAARLENLQGQSDTLGRIEERHKALDELLGRGGGSDSERQKLANMVSHPRFRAWAESNGYEANALGIANRASGGGSAVLDSYVPGRDDLKAALHFQHQLQNPDSYRSILSPFGQRSRSGKYVVVTDKVSVENARGLIHKTGKYADRWVSLDDHTGNPRLLNQRQYLEHAQKYVSPEVEALTIVDTRYARAGGTYYKYLPGTGKWAQTPAPEGGAEVTGMPLALATDGAYSRFATVADLTEGGGKGMATRQNGNGLIPVPKPENVAKIKALGGEITPHQQPPEGMWATYAGELLTQHAIDVRNSRDKGAVDIKVHGLNGIRTFSGDDPITIDIVQKDDDTGLSDIFDAWRGVAHAETARDAAGAAPSNAVTTQSGAHTIIDRSNDTSTAFGRAKIDILRRARGLPAEGPDTEEAYEQVRADKEELALVPEQVAPVEGIMDPTQVAADPATLEDPGTPSGQPLVVPPVSGGPPMPPQKYHVPVELKSGETKIAGITATSPEDAARRVAAHYGDNLESAGDPAVAPGDMPGTYAAAGGPAKAAAVAAHARAQKISTPLTPGRDKAMPKLDQLRAASEQALLMSAEKPTDRDLKAAARTAKTTYEAAARTQLKDRAELRRHAAGESIAKIQAPPAPAPAPVAAPAPAPITTDAARDEVARRAKIVGALRLRNVDSKAEEAELTEAGGIYKDLLLEERAASQIRPSVAPSAESERGYEKRSEKDIDAEIYRLTASARPGERAPPEPGIRDEPYSEEQAAWSSYKAADKAFKAAQAEGGPGLEPSRMARLGAKDKYRDEWLGLNPDATEQDFMRAMNTYKGIAPLPPLSPPPQAEEGIGAKLRSVLGLGPKGKKAELVDSVQEQSTAPSEPEVHGKSGAPAQKPLREGESRSETYVDGKGWVQDADDEEDDDE